ncbi:P63C domain-containing protein [Pseudomonas sp. DWP3-1-2]|uniref:P63C domain-containing protein n=1 Tax=Pseudomonas sp. DWP3-1-2 TaxID=2804645 RepID=UPI003CECA521
MTKKIPGAKPPTGKAKGGVARAAKLTPDRRSEIAKSGAQAKQEVAQLPKVTHGSSDRPLKIGDVEMACYVLEDETRVISQSGLLLGLGMTKGSTRSGDDRLTVLAKSLEGNGLINSELTEVIKNPIRFRPPHGGRSAYGYPATVLADLCEAVLAARSAGSLSDRQAGLAKQCEALIRGFARVGIVALVDEATGYQKDRARDALAKILEAFVAKEMQPYVSKFPAEFYEEMFRLRGLPFNSTSVKRPPYFGHLTNDVVYRRLAPGVWQDLKEKVKRNSEGRPTHQLHRLLTPDVGDPRLKELLLKVVTVMQLSVNWQDFKDKLDRILPPFEMTLSLPLELESDSGEGI